MSIEAIISKAEQSGIQLTTEQANIVMVYWIMTQDTDWLFGMPKEKFASLVESAIDKFIGAFRTERDFGEWFVENSEYWKRTPEIVQVCVDYDSVFNYLYTGGDIDYQDGYYFWGER